MKVIIREVAYGDLDRIYSWIAKDRPPAADAVVDRILDSIEQLGRFPFMGHIGRAPDTHEWVVPGLPYIIVYTLEYEADELAVTAIFHAAQDRGKKRT
ncbi:MAG TPA: type II toxin-antitoxin system RelE/ParE family toxin [Pseudorhodoplanes sp.]|nr:type II toxin-antitoxin system RelE/ParE family toxin [Pseudorhodoplanes sp.]